MIPSPIYCINWGAANQPQAAMCFTCGQSLQILSSCPTILSSLEYLYYFN